MSLESWFIELWMLENIMIRHLALYHYESYSDLTRHEKEITKRDHFMDNDYPSFHKSDTQYTCYHVTINEASYIKKFKDKNMMPKEYKFRLSDGSNNIYVLSNNRIIHFEDFEDDPNLIWISIYVHFHIIEEKEYLATLCIALTDNFYNSISFDILHKMKDFMFENEDFWENFWNRRIYRSENFWNIHISSSVRWNEIHKIAQSHFNKNVSLSLEFFTKSASSSLEFKKVFPVHYHDNQYLATLCAVLIGYNWPLNNIDLPFNVLLKLRDFIFQNDDFWEYCSYIRNWTGINVYLNKHTRAQGFFISTMKIVKKIKYRRYWKLIKVSIHLNKMYKRFIENYYKPNALGFYKTKDHYEKLSHK